MSVFSADHRDFLQGTLLEYVPVGERIFKDEIGMRSKRFGTGLKRALSKIGKVTLTHLKEPEKNAHKDVEARYTFSVDAKNGERFDMSIGVHIGRHGAALIPDFPDKYKSGWSGDTGDGDDLLRAVQRWALHHQDTLGKRASKGTRRSSSSHALVFRAGDTVVMQADAGKAIWHKIQQGMPVTTGPKTYKVKHVGSDGTVTLENGKKHSQSELAPAPKIRETAQYKKYHDLQGKGGVEKKSTPDEALLQRTGYTSKGFLAYAVRQLSTIGTIKSTPLKERTRKLSSTTYWTWRSGLTINNEYEVDLEVNADSTLPKHFTLKVGSIFGALRADRALSETLITRKEMPSHLKLIARSLEDQMDRDRFFKGA
jgi:hypothetical protein